MVLLGTQDLDFLQQTLTFWPYLTPGEARLLKNNVELVSYQAGEVLYSPHRECLGLLAVQSGELRAYLLSEDGREITLYRLRAGEVCILSASCVLRCITFEVQMDARQDSRVLLVNPAAFAHLSKQNLHIENFALKTGMERFSQVMWAMEQMLFMRFDRRLAAFLLEETDKSGSDILHLTHEQIARYLGSAREVVSRMLGHFASQGLVELCRGGVRLLDRTALRRLV